MSCQFYGKHGPGQNTLYEPHPLESVSIYLANLARQHRAEAKACRAPWKKEAENRRAEQVEAQLTTLTAFIRGA